jgi:hypothetical protein
MQAQGRMPLLCFRYTPIVFGWVRTETTTRILKLALDKAIVASPTHLFPFFSSSYSRGNRVIYVTTMSLSEPCHHLLCCYSSPLYPLYRRVKYTLRQPPPERSS